MFVKSNKNLKGEVKVIILGEKVKELRKNKRFSQKQLAEGICTQVTISKIENHNSIPTMNILSKLCERLGVDIHDVCINEGDSNENYAIFQQVDQLCDIFQYKEAYEILKKKLNEERLSTIHEKKMYFYLMGKILLMGFNDIEEALHYLNLELIVDRSERVDFTDVLVSNTIGVAYHLKKETSKAKIYFVQSIQDLEKLTNHDLKNLDKILLIYFNTAKFYSDIGDYHEAIKLCETGIQMAEAEKTTSQLDKLYYEKAFNEAMNGQLEEAKKGYFIAMAFAIMNKNDVIIEIIKKNMNKFKLTFDKLFI
ncbi:hypothetical protein CKN80_12855 [Carnobacterium divergens]|nr:hypothetical protein CKN79_12850 [Carnobacterium divergens]TFJ50585.1 hypothetical protein CKN80_12855 [Carnobacterium divergens]